MWTRSARSGPHNQRHNLVESRVATFKRFECKVFNNKFLPSRQILDILYPDLKTSFADFSASNLRGIFDHCKQIMKLLKDTYNQVLISNFSKYSLKPGNKNGPKPDYGNIVIFYKDQDYYYGIIEDLLADQVKIISIQTEYVRRRKV